MNEQKFDGMGRIYSRFRPGYPDAFLDDLYGPEGVTSASVIADVGSGTGILTQQLLGRGSRAFAVEPSGDMRGIAEERLCTFPKFRSVNGTAEQTTLPDGSVDFVTAAQAFHWFDKPRFRAECGRILTRGGRVILVWNSRDAKSELVTETDEVHRSFCPNFKGFSGGTRGVCADEEFAEFFTGGYEEKTYQNDLAYDRKGFIGRNLSASYALKQSEEGYADYVAALDAVFLKYSKDGHLTMPNRTHSYIGRVI